VAISSMHRVQCACDACTLWFRDYDLGELELTVADTIVDDVTATSFTKR
jgi:hypothetical protein